MSNPQPIARSFWSGKTAVVVGASVGLGRHLVEALAAQGAAHVVLVARDLKRLETTERELARRWPDTRFSLCAADASVHYGSQRVAEHVQGLGLKVDLLVNAVGQSDRGAALKLTGERLDELMRANVHAPLGAIQALASEMAKEGTIVNIGSLSSLFAPRFLGGYSLAKHALRALTQQLRLELKEQGLHVMLVCPGPIARAEQDGSRYAHLATAGDVPAEALRGGGGAKLRGLDPEKLATDILHAAAERKVQIIRPRKAILLVWLMALCPRLGESMLRRMTQ